MQAVQNIQRDELKTHANSAFWGQFHDDFQMHASHIKQLSEWAQLAMLTLYSQMLNNSKYQHAIERAKIDMIKDNNLVISLFENSSLHVNLVSLKFGSDLPLHDHPGSAGSMMVISGDVRVIVCEESIPVSKTNQSRTLLTVTENKIFSTGETSCFTLNKHNIHSFEALTDRAVLMVVHTPPFAVTQQSYFFTAAPLQKVSSQVLAQRVRVQANRNLNQNKHHYLRDVAK